MQLHCVFRDTDEEAYIHGLADYGLDGIEVLHCRPYLDLDRFAAFERRIRCLQQCHCLGLSVHAPHIGVHLASRNRPLRILSQDLVWQSALWAATLGAEVLVIHPGMGVDGMPQGAWHHDPELTPAAHWQEQAVDLLAPFLQRCADQFPELLLAVENMIFPHELFRTPDDLRCLLAAVDRERVGACLDMGHAAAAGQDPTDFWHTLGRKIGHIHAHDNHGSCDEHLPLGAGTTAAASFLAHVQRNHYGGIVTLEYRIEDPVHLKRFQSQGPIF